MLYWFYRVEKALHPGGLFYFPKKPMPPKIHAPKRRGEWVELQFMARATGKGFTVSKPWGDSARYDFAVEHGGKFHRVQVKSTTFKDSYGSYVCGCIANQKLGPYSADEIEFIAAYVISCNAWYIVPIAAIARSKRTISLNPHRRSLRPKYERYREAWDLLRE